MLIVVLQQYWFVISPILSLLSDGFIFIITLSPKLTGLTSDWPDLAVLLFPNIYIIDLNINEFDGIDMSAILL